MQGAYLEDFQRVKVILKKDCKFDFNGIYICEPQKIQLDLAKKTLINQYWHLEYNLSSVLDPHIDYYLYINDETELHIKLGKITRSPLFEKKFYTTEKLGFIYNKEYTEFRLWTPVAKEVILVLPNMKTEYSLFYQKEGVWKFKVYGNLDKQPYYYMVRIDDDFVKCLDPYAVSTYPNFKYNFVVDLESTYQSKYDRPSFSGCLTDSIILEMHLKDFGYLLPSNSSYYQKAFEEFENIGLNYVKSLGVTHVQLLPINGFEGIDELNPDKKYNWGYNPAEYFSVTGWYSSNPKDPYTRINELKELIDVYHKNGLLVNLDVVFNHVYNHKSFSLSKLVPGYVFRIDKIDFMTNGSGCGNDLSTEHLMVRRLIVDALKFYMEFYKFDGFRFDLMGLIDTETIKIAFEELKKINPQVILYGEGWQMSTGLKKELLAFNRKDLPNVGYFNDYFRNIIKGSPFDLGKGFIMGTATNPKEIGYLIQGCDNPVQSLNFIECHDNYTLYDQIKLSLPNSTEEERKNCIKLGLALVCISQGTPFINLGMEFGRTKNCIDNSYNSPMEINQINWENIKKYQEVVDSLIDIISIRKKYELFRLKDKDNVDKYTVFKTHNGYFEYCLSNEHNGFTVLFSNNYNLHEHSIKGTLIYDGKSCNSKVDSVILNKPSLYIIKTK